jgi:hypothetical protein
VRVASSVDGFSCAVRTAAACCESIRNTASAGCSIAAFALIGAASDWRRGVDEPARRISSRCRTIGCALLYVWEFALTRALAARSRVTVEEARGLQAPLGNGVGCHRRRIGGSGLCGDAPVSGAAPRIARASPTLAFLFSHPAHFIALGFGAGLAPFAPGTFGTLVAIPIAVLFWTHLPDAAFAITVIAFAGSGSGLHR